MKQLTACCGLDCESCEARIATIANDDELREKTARKWSAMNNAPEITASTINCMGCRTDGVKFAYCSDYCQIRKCAHEKGFGTCGDCKELDNCTTVGAIFQHSPGAKENLKAWRPFYLRRQVRRPTKKNNRHVKASCRRQCSGAEKQTDSLIQPLSHPSKNTSAPRRKI